MFTNRLFSRFFDNGQVIDTIRGGGIFQPAVDKAIKLLEDGEWVCQHVLSAGLMVDTYLSRGQDQPNHYKPRRRFGTVQMGRVSHDHPNKS